VLTGTPWLTPGRIRSEPLVPDQTTAAGRGVATVAQAVRNGAGGGGIAARLDLEVPCMV
jgi:hypothetical protein